MTGGGRLRRVVGTLEGTHGPADPGPARGPLEWILWENVGYLVDDDRRERAFLALRDRVGLTAGALLGAKPETLLAVARLGGIHPERRADRLREIGRIALEEHGGDLDAVVRRRPAEAIRALRKYPGIGRPGAEKILALSGAAPVLALDSNGLRVLLRLGFGSEKRGHASTYRSVREAAAEDPGPRTRAGWMGRAHRVLRRHGRTLCRATEPACELCPLSASCRFSLDAAGSGPTRRPRRPGEPSR